MSRLQPPYKTLRQHTDVVLAYPAWQVQGLRLPDTNPLCAGRAGSWDPRINSLSFVHSAMTNLLERQGSLFGRVFELM
jgi:hypothetical protein